MALLELERVSKLYRRGSRERMVLSDVSLSLEAGELVGVWGMRGSGRSTLLRVAAGIEPPDSGLVRFDGAVVSGGRGGRSREEIGFCQRALRPAEGRVVLEHASTGLLARGMREAPARERARRALARAGAEECAMLEPSELDAGEAVRVAIARALALAPRLLIIDEPTAGVEPEERDGLLGLLRSLADEGIAVLASAGALSAGLAGADRALALREGALHGERQPELAQVVELHGPSTWRATG
ncbi:MAG TPA: ATP-binding cassette domain-containing protein [Solirubrobacteraceae bacterium]|nr:ATP-binding cassette domain-containing protein [Solirubrobacteraceae bacterium]